MTNLLGSIRLAGYAFPLIAALVAVPFFDRQVRARCFNWVRTVFGGLFLFYVLCVLALVFFPLPDAAQAARLSGYEIQLVPFQFVADFLRETPLVLSDARTYLPALFDRTVLQVVCNILMLLPFGMYLRYVCGLDLGKVALASLAFSAFIELGQLTGLFFVFRGSYRLCDVDDLMLNTLGGLLGGYIVCRILKLSTWTVADFAIVGVPLALALGRCANFVNGELWGKPTDLPWGVIFGGTAGDMPRHPSQLYEAFLEGIVLFCILQVLSRKKPLLPQGTFMGVFVMGYGIVRFLIEFVRVPDAQLGYLLGGVITMGQLLSLPLVIAGLALVIFALRRNRPQRIYLDA